MKTYRIIDGKFCVIGTASPPTIKVYGPDEMVGGVPAAIAALGRAGLDAENAYPDKGLSIGEALLFATLREERSPEERALHRAQGRAATEIIALDQRIEVLDELWKDMDRALSAQLKAQDIDEDDDYDIPPEGANKVMVITTMLRECRDRRAALIAPYNAAIDKAVAALVRTINPIGA